MEDYEILLAEVVTRHYEEMLRRVTRCARGNASRAEDAISTVLERMLRNRGTYEYRVFRGQDGDVYIRTDKGAALLKDYIVGAACRQLRSGPQPDPLPPNWAAPAAQPGKHASQMFEELRPCLDRLTNFDQMIAVVSYLEDYYFALHPFFADYVCRRVLHNWPGGQNPTTCCSDQDFVMTVYYVAIRAWQTRTPVARRTDRFRGLQVLRRCLGERGFGFPPDEPF